MFLTKEKLLTDRSFINSVADAITKTNRSYITRLFESLQPDSDTDLAGKERADILIEYLYEPLLEKLIENRVIPNTIEGYIKLHKFFPDQIYDALANKITEEDLLPKIVDAIINRLLETEDGNEKITEILDKTNDIIVEHKKKSKEPWVNIVGDVWDDNEGKFKVSLDWNDSFITMLRKQGLTGEEDSEIVESWLQGLANQ